MALSPATAQQTLPVTPSGQKLKDFYLSLHVEDLWIAEHHVDWETGIPDMPQSTHGNKTHCSAFVAAACMQLNIYILRPPEHGQLLLANAQADWLAGDASIKYGWHKIIVSDSLYIAIQRLANDGKMVVAIYKNSIASQPGHAALVMPSNRSARLIGDEGPELIMAGTHNHNFISLKNGFHSHISEWPEPQILFYVNDGGANRLTILQQ